MVRPSSGHRASIRAANQYDQEESDAESDASSASPKVFDDDKDGEDEPEMMEVWDTNREREATGRLHDFYIMMACTIVVFSVIHLFQIPAFIFAILVLIFGREKVYSVVFLVMDWIAAIEGPIDERLELWARAVWQLGKAVVVASYRKMAHLCKALGNIVHVTGLCMFLPNPNTPHPDTNAPFRQSLVWILYHFRFTITGIVIGLVFILYENKFSPGRIPRDIKTAIFVFTVITAGLLDLHEHVSLIYLHGLVSLSLYTYVTWCCFCIATRVQGLKTWGWIPLPWKGTEPIFAVYPLWLSETTRLVDVKILGSRWKTRRIAFWKLYRMWYYLTIVSAVVCAVMIPMALSKLLGWADLAIAKKYQSKVVG